MSKRPPKPLDLSRGSIIHIEQFKSFGFDAKDKYVLIIGHESPSHVLCFTVTSQDWTTHPTLCREVVDIPVGSVRGLPKRSWVKCFQNYERLSVGDLQAGFTKFVVAHKGHLPLELFAKVRSVIFYSDVLKAVDIDDCLSAIDQDKSSLPAS